MLTVLRVNCTTFVSGKLYRQGLKAKHIRDQTITYKSLQLSQQLLVPPTCSTLLSKWDNKILKEKQTGIVKQNMPPL